MSLSHPPLSLESRDGTVARQRGNAPSSDVSLQWSSQLDGFQAHVSTLQPNHNAPPNPRRKTRASLFCFFWPIPSQLTQAFIKHTLQICEVSLDFVSVAIHTYRVESTDCGMIVQKFLVHAFADVAFWCCFYKFTGRKNNTMTRFDGLWTPPLPWHILSWR